MLTRAEAILLMAIFPTLVVVLVSGAPNFRLIVASLLPGVVIVGLYLWSSAGQPGPLIWGWGPRPITLLRPINPSQRAGTSAGARPKRADFMARRKKTNIQSFVPS